MLPNLENKIKTNSQRHDYSGSRYGRLRVISYSHSEKKRGPIWKCQCDCGADCFVVAKELRAGDTKSCGCLYRTQFITHGLSKSAEHKAWTAIKERCYNPNCKSYYRYGGRGIKMCERWLNSFEAFYTDMGPRPSSEHSIDREDTFGNYEPSNCRWATIIEQQNNMRTNVVLEFQGRKATLAEWSRLTGITYTALSTRLDRGWTVERALSQPMEVHNSRTNTTKTSP